LRKWTATGRKSDIKKNHTFGLRFMKSPGTEIPEMEFKASYEYTNEANIQDKKNAYFCLAILV
jgi:hypothetical protein